MQRGKEREDKVDKLLKWEYKGKKERKIGDKERGRVWMNDGEREERLLKKIQIN